MKEKEAHSESQDQDVLAVDVSGKLPKCSVQAQNFIANLFNKNVQQTNRYNKSLQRRTVMKTYERITNKRIKA